MKGVIVMNIKEVANNPQFQGLISIAAAVIMYFTPDEIDHIIEGMLSVFGIAKLTIQQKKDNR